MYQSKKLFPLDGLRAKSIFSFLVLIDPPSSAQLSSLFPSPFKKGAARPEMSGDDRPWESVLRGVT